MIAPLYLENITLSNLHAEKNLHTKFIYIVRDIEAWTSIVLEYL